MEGSNVSPETYIISKIFSIEMFSQSSLLALTCWISCLNFGSLEDIMDSGGLVRDILAGNRLDAS